MIDYFYKPIELETENILFTSDLHLGHKKEFLYGKRGFDNIEDHDRFVVEKWNECADNETVGFSLGDILFGYDGHSRLLSVLEHLNFKTLYMMSGNHHAGFKQLIQETYDQTGSNVLDLGHKEVIFVPNYLELIVKGDKERSREVFVLSHYPILSYNGQAKSIIHLFGHVHRSLGNSEIGSSYELKGKVLEVTVENQLRINGGKPFSFDDIIKIMGQRESVSYDHHDKHTSAPI